MVDTQQLVELFKKMNRFDSLLGLELKINEQGAPYYELPIRADHESSPQTAHGAVIAGMMDAQLGILALNSAVTRGMFCSTVELKTNFFHPARVGDTLIGGGELDFQGKSLVVVSAWLTLKSTNQLAAKGIGTFNLYPMSKRQNILQSINGEDL
jgi:acyl-coenzyme A thioesterase PaaI-like protein